MEENGMKDGTKKLLICGSIAFNALTLPLSIPLMTAFGAGMTVVVMRDTYLSLIGRRDEAVLGDILTEFGPEINYLYDQYRDFVS